MTNTDIIDLVKTLKSKTEERINNAIKFGYLDRVNELGGQLFAYENILDHIENTKREES